jgi:hypothetical protein
MSRFRAVLFAAGCALAALAAASADAAVVLKDDFDSEAGGQLSIQAYAGFANFDVTRGTVDLVADAYAAGYPCAGGVISACVDLGPAGTRGGTITTKQSYAFAPGDLVELVIFAGNRLGSDTSDVFAGFRFDAPVSIDSYVQGSLAFSDMPYVNHGDFADITTISSRTTPSAYGGLDFIAFKAASAGSVRVFVGSDGGSAAGPVLDNLSLSIGPGDAPGPPPPPPPPSPTPEPAAWVMMLSGFGGLGAAMRRHRRRQAPAA